MLRNHVSRIKLASLACVLICARGLSAAEFEWGRSTPAAEDISEAKLEEFKESLAARGTSGLLVIRHDRIVFEWYAPGSAADKPHGTASLAKAVVGGMSLAVAMQDGRIRPDDFAADYIPQWKPDPQKSKITIGQLATHSSGLDDAEESGVAHEKLAGWKGDFWRRQPDPFSISRDLTPAIFPPGQKISYSNPGMAMLSYAVTAAIQPGEQKDVRELLRQRVYRPIGIADNQWSVGYGATYKVGGLDLVANWGGASFTARAVARIGRLMLRQGDWDGRQILGPQVVRACIDGPGAPWRDPPQPTPGFGWWNNQNRAFKTVPKDMFMGAGAGHQLLIVIPSLDLIVVRNGVALVANDDFHPTVNKYVLAPLMQTIVEPPYRPSDVIRSVRFESPILRKAVDSDNWPLTWADDDSLYTSYGDGSGFEPFIDKKLSLGLARVEGMPPEFKGINIRSPSAERTGGGARGPKASGMLMADGVLYMWVRNTRNATLTWSADHGATWEWGFTFDTSFGSPAFLNFGRNYQGSRDDYVYVYSQDGPSAYDPSDALILARVPRQRVRERAAYQFLTGMDRAGGAPTWTSDISARAPVFHYPNHCNRVDAVYSPGIGRYLIALSFGAGKGWGIFDAPEPWGPWTTAFYTSDWGLGETHGYRLPSKWIAPDGASMWLVFSGRSFQGVNYDAFCARRVTLDLYKQDK